MDKRGFLKNFIVGSAGVLSLSLWNKPALLAKERETVRYVSPKIDYIPKKEFALLYSKARNEVNKLNTWLDISRNPGKVKLRDILSSQGLYGLEAKNCAIKLLQYRMALFTLHPDKGMGKPDELTSSCIKKGHGSIRHFYNKLENSILDAPSGTYVWGVLKRGKLEIVTLDSDLTPFSSLSYGRPVMCFSNTIYKTDNPKILQMINWDYVNMKLQREMNLS